MVVSLSVTIAVEGTRVVYLEEARDWGEEEEEGRGGRGKGMVGVGLLVDESTRSNHPPFPYSYSLPHNNIHIALSS